VPLAAPAWAPLVRTYAGVPQLSAEWVGEHLGEVRLVDVREPAELVGALGHIQGVEPVPLGTLRSVLGEWDRDTPIVTVCRSGGRSAQAVAILESEGFPRVANLAGGMIAWHSARLPVVAAGSRP
jgi:rhodanese-related sulfurtransferase